MVIKKMESLAKAIIQALEKKKQTPSWNQSDFDFTLPIKTICGINVCAEFKARKNNSRVYWIAFNVECFDICDEHEDSHTIYYRNLVPVQSLDLETLTVEQIIPYIEQILAIIPTLKFNKKTSWLTADEFFSDDVVELFKFDNTTIFDVCSVCHEFTNSKTDCDHTLCLVCMSSIKGHFDEGEHIRHCPLCREHIHRVNY
jgi:hypothetical protein